MVSNVIVNRLIFRDEVFLYDRNGPTRRVIKGRLGYDVMVQGAVSFDTNLIYDSWQSARSVWHISGHRGPYTVPLL